MSGELLRGVPHQLYHLDDLPGTSHFSRSVACRILHQSPLHAYQAHPKLGGASEDEPSEVMDKGALIHQLLLGGGPEIVAVDFPDWRKDAAKVQREAAREAGKLPILVHLLAECETATDAIRQRLLDLEIVVGHAEDSEITALWEDGGTPCKARLDLYFGGDTVLDLKVQRNLAVSAFEWGVKKLGLDIQAHAYQAAVVARFPELAGRTTFEWVLVERKPPYDVAIIPASASVVSLGESRWKRALSIWRRCLESGKWPGTGRLPALEARPYDLEQEFTAAVHAAGEPTWASGD